MGARVQAAPVGGREFAAICAGAQTFLMAAWPVEQGDRLRIICSAGSLAGCSIMARAGVVHAYPGCHVASLLCVGEEVPA